VDKQFQDNGRGQIARITASPAQPRAREGQTADIALPHLVPRAQGGLVAGRDCRDHDPFGKTDLNKRPCG
jgi:hypothetical protein